MKKTVIVPLAVLIFGCVLMTGTIYSQGGADDIIKGMMSPEQMTALQALGKLRNGELAGDKAKFEIAKNNLIILIRDVKRDYTVRLLAADTAAYFNFKKAIPPLRALIPGEMNPMLKMSFQNSLDRLEGRVKGDVYREKPSYSGTPRYHGTPRFHGTPRR